MSELVRVVSEQTGTQAQLVAMPDENGELVPAIYIPERAIPVLFQHLSPAERFAVTRVLNQTVSDAI